MKKAENYAYKVYQTKSFSKAAKMLYISQPSLSATIKKLENELGFEIFDRSKNLITLTPEGTLYIEYLEECMHNKRDMYYRISQLSSLSGEKLYVGGRNYFARIFLPKICGEFHRQFPDVEIKIDLGEAGTLNDITDKLDSGQVECILGFVCDESRYSYVPLFNDRIVIAIRRDTPGAEELLPYALTREEILSGKEFPDKKADNSLFEKFEFIRYGKTSNIKQDIPGFMERCRISRCYTMNSRKYDIKYDMMLEGMGCVIVSELLLKQRPDRCDEVLYFLPDVAPGSRQAKVIYKKSTPLSGSAKEFIKIAQQMFADF